METLITEQDFEPEGILNSNYKNIVKRRFNTSKVNSIFSIKQRVKSRQHKFISSTGTMLKVGLFASLLVAVFS